MAKLKHLSKTQLQAGQKCPKLLYLKKFHYNDLPAPDLESQERFDQGNTVGELAVRYFSQICDARYGKNKHIYIDKKPWEKDDAIIETEEAIEKGYRMIFEGASESDKDGVWAKNDIVEILDDGSINLYEVKATKSAPGTYHFNDASIQYNAFNGAGYTINKVFLVTVNPDFIRDTTFNFHEYFVITDVTKKVVKIAKDSCEEVPSLLEMINKSKMPEISIGSHCLKGFACDAYSICWGEKSKYGVAKLLSRQWRLRNKLIDQGKILIEDLTPEDVKEFDPTIKIDYDVYMSKKPQINKNGLKSFLNQLKYPVYYLDYETINSIIPPFVGTTPGEQIPFQFSLHIQRSEDFNSLEHFEFLHKDKSDPREALCKALSEHIKDDGGSVVVYYKEFECGVNNRLGEFNPEYKDFFKMINKRVVDLIEPFKKKDLYHPAQESSDSLKYTLPAWVSDISYDNMNIQNGAQAFIGMLNYLRGKMSEDESEKFLSDLLKYCELDTLAMVKLMEALTSFSKD